MNIRSCMECGRVFIPSDKQQVVCDECDDEIAIAEEEESEE